MSEQPPQPPLDPPDVMERVHQYVRAAVELAGLQYHTGILALEIRDRVRDEEPGLYDQWVDILAVDQLKIAIARLRTVARRRASVVHRDGVFEQTEEVDGAHTQRRVGDMVKSDCLYVARQYSKRAKVNSLRSRRFRALAERLPDDITRVREIVTQEELSDLYDSE